MFPLKKTVLGIVDNEIDLLSFVKAALRLTLGIYPQVYMLIQALPFANITSNANTRSDFASS